MKNSNLKMTATTAHFKPYARQKVRELGIDGAVRYIRDQMHYSLMNNKYEATWLKYTVYSMMLDYVVNDLGE